VCLFFPNVFEIWGGGVTDNKSNGCSGLKTGVIIMCVVVGDGPIVSLRGSTFLGALRNRPYSVEVDEDRLLRDVAFALWPSD